MALKLCSANIFMAQNEHAQLDSGAVRVLVSTGLP